MVSADFHNMNSGICLYGKIIVNVNHHLFFAGKKSHSLILAGYHPIRYEGKGEGMREMSDLISQPASHQTDTHV